MNTPFAAVFFAANRQKLYEQLKPNSLLVMTAYGEMQQVFDYAFRFEQESNFWYMTGIDYADWLLIVDVDARQEWLVAPQLLEVQQIFDGSLDPELAKKQSGVEQVLNKRDGSKLLKKLLESKKQSYAILPQPSMYYGFHTNPAQRKLATKLKGKPVHDVRPLLAKQRAIKQPLEIKALQHAIDVTINGLKKALQQLPQLRSENEVDALLTHEFRRMGLKHGFDPIVAAGPHTTTMHYLENNSPFGQKDWLLMDVGARSNHYTADISRTVPLGKPTERELELYESLRGDQQTIIQLAQPNTPTRHYLEQAEQVLYDSFVRLGLLDQKAERRAIYKVMPHAISHGLGLDAHDSLGRPEKLLPGMVLTAEIGLYIWDEHFGLRLEDDILITKDGPRNLSGALSTSLDKLLPDFS